MPKTRPNRPIAPTWIQCAKGGTGMTRSHRGTAEPVVFIGFFHGYALYRQTKKSQKKVAKKLAKHFAKIGAAVQPNLAKLAAKHELHARVGAYRATNAWWRPVPWRSEDLKKKRLEISQIQPEKNRKKDHEKSTIPNIHPCDDKPNVSTILIRCAKVATFDPLVGSIRRDRWLFGQLWLHKLHHFTRWLTQPWSDHVPGLSAGAVCEWVVKQPFWFTWNIHRAQMKSNYIITRLYSMIIHY